MARILLSVFSNSVFGRDTQYQMDCFCEQYANVLKRNGNEILYFQSNLNSVYLKNKFLEGVDKNTIKDTILKFNPELILTFNNVLPEDVLSYTNCPVLLYVADTCAFWNEIDDIEKNKERYWFTSPTEKVTKEYKERLKIPEDRILPFGYATDMVNIDIKQDTNITFLGSIGSFSDYITNYFNKVIEKPGLSSEQKNSLKNEFFSNFDKIKENTLQNVDFNITGYNNQMFQTAAILAITCKKRFETLCALSDLGLKIKGISGQWIKAFQYNYDLYKNFEYGYSISYEQNKITYNSSKITLNPPHANSSDGFSWRVTDILASNSALLSVKKKDLIDLSKGYIDLPMFESPLEAREIALKLLGDEKYRKDIVLACNKMMDDKCRFEKYLKLMEEYIPNIKCFLNKEGSFEMLDIKVKHKNKLPLMDKIRYKIWHHQDKILRKKGII